jgi:MoxR-like ATPase
MALEIPQASSESERVIHEVERAIVGKRILLERVMAGVLCGGHMLLEDYPGLGKTLLAKSFAVALGLAFKRIQFTPDLLPTDITGGYVFDRDRNSFVLRPGPIFANIILADEINRASPKTQSALLEAMQEQQVTLEGVTMRLPGPFIVMATQNPIEYEGTFPLPEAQLDRFIMKLSVGYPSPDEEREILHRRGDRQSDDISLQQITDGERLIGLGQVVERVHVDGDIEQYIVDLISQTRRRRQVAVGASPRASLALLKLARACAAMQGRSYVLPDDVKRYVRPVLIHRLILQPDLWMNRDAADEVISDILQSVAVPVIAGA